jgi:excisionase family DNA binding protein
MPIEIPDKLFFKAQEVASILRLKVKRVYNLCDEGILKTAKIGVGLRIKRESIIEFLRHKDKIKKEHP